MSGAANRDNLEKINWFITESQNALLDHLSMDGRSRSEHLRNAIDAYIERGDIVVLQEPLVKSVFHITKAQKTRILTKAAAHSCSEAVVLRSILSHLQRKQL